MPKPLVPAEYAAMLARPNPCMIATVKSDDAPVTVATWYVWDGGRGFR